MELVKVVLEYQDRFCPEGEAKIAEARRWAVEPCGLPRKRVEVMAAVHGSYGVGILQRAGEVALCGVIGKTWEGWEAEVVAAEHVGSVYVEMRGPEEE